MKITCRFFKGSLNIIRCMLDGIQRVIQALFILSSFNGLRGSVNK